jgi:trk system potassium uptake protein TrkH
MLKKFTPVQLVVLSFLAVIITGAILLMLPYSSASNRFTDPITAIFTATSATCVTGLVVVDIGTHWSLFGQIVILLLIQIGGLGYMTISTFFLIFSNRKITLRQRFMLKEGLNVYKLTGIISFAKTIFFTVLFFEGLGAVALSIRFLKDYTLLKSAWMGVFHTVSAFCNAGFDIVGNFKSFTGYANDMTINLTVMTLIVFGGIGFYVIWEISNKIKDHFVSKERKKLSLHSKLVLRITAMLIIASAVFILLLEWNNPKTLGVLPLRGKILASFFQSITTRTAGFSTLNIGSMTQATLLGMIILMFIGGSPGGTAGGIKTTTFTVVMLLLLSAYREKMAITTNGRTVKLSIARRAVFIMGFAIFIILLATFLILVAQGQKFNFFQVLFEVTSAFGTVGLTTGITPNLSNFSRIVIIATMFIGRVGPLSFILSFVTRKELIRPEYPEEEVVVG